jgi:tRNA (cmo5U34)-methyltransferase
VSDGQFDVAVAGAVLHHLRTDAEWRAVFAKIHCGLSPGGSFWIWDMVLDESPEIYAIQWKRYGEYLTNLKNAAYRDEVFAYVEKEDTPRSLLFQVDLLREVGFSSVEILHKHAIFAAFGAVKSSPKH